jgi:hypothetical protein
MEPDGVIPELLVIRVDKLERDISSRPPASLGPVNSAQGLSTYLGKYLSRTLSGVSLLDRCLVVRFSVDCFDTKTCHVEVPRPGTLTLVRQDEIEENRQTQSSFQSFTGFSNKTDHITARPTCKIIAT